MEGADAKVAAEGGSGGFKEVGEFAGGLLAMWKGKLGHRRGGQYF